MAPQTRRTPRPKTAKSKAMTKTKPTTSMNDKTAMIATTGTTKRNKGGRHADDESFSDRFGDLCKYRGYNGRTKVPETNAGKNKSSNWVHYIRKRNARCVFPDHHMDALN
jgi:hypothetical protein